MTIKLNKVFLLAALTSLIGLSSSGFSTETGWKVETTKSIADRAGRQKNVYDSSPSKIFKIPMFDSTANCVLLKAKGPVRRASCDDGKIEFSQRCDQNIFKFSYVVKNRDFYGVSFGCGDRLSDLAVEPKEIIINVQSKNSQKKWEKNLRFNPVVDKNFEIPSEFSFVKCKVVSEIISLVECSNNFHFAIDCNQKNEFYLSGPNQSEYHVQVNCKE